MSDLFVACAAVLQPWLYIKIPLAKVRKGVWRMPRLTEAMKDVISCDKHGVGANNP